MIKRGCESPDELRLEKNQGTVIPYSPFRTHSVQASAVWQSWQRKRISPELLCPAFGFCGPKDSPTQQLAIDVREGSGGMNCYAAEHEKYASSGLILPRLGLSHEACASERKVVLKMRFAACVESLRALRVSFRGRSCHRKELRTSSQVDSPSN